MNNNMNRVLVLAVFFVTVITLGWNKEAPAELQVNINIDVPPPLQFTGPPDVYVVPSGSSYVYMAPDYEGVYFYGGSWYRSYNDRWYRSSHYNERWDYIETSNVPHVIIVVPPQYIHHVPSGYHRIHYDDYHNNWQSWDQGRHWDSYDWYQHERRDDTRRERYEHIERDHHHRNDLTPQHQGYQQHNVQPSQHQQKQGHQQQKVKSSQHQQKQGHQQHNARKPQKENSQKQQKHDGGQKHQEQQGGKEHGSNK
jgi:hypothetical protein